jgi:hypothetical protein
VKIAEDDYLLVKGTDFIENIEGSSDDFGRFTETGATSGAVDASRCETGAVKKEKSFEKPMYFEASMSGIGLEPTTSTMST